MRKVILLIKNWLNERRVQKVIKEAESQNLSPRTYKVWEHKEWGNRISIRHVNDNGTFNITINPDWNSVEFNSTF